MTLRRLPVLALLPLLLTLTACGGDDASGETSASGQCTYSDAERAAKDAEKPPADPPEDLPTEVTITTNRGAIKVSLDADQAPCTVNSFVSLAEQGYFDDTPCHRLTAPPPADRQQGALQVLQCGDPSGSGSAGPGYEFDDELVPSDPRLQPCTGQVDPSSGQEVCTYTTGTVAMANAGPGTNGSQFFLVYGDSLLGSAYTVFGRMNAEGLKVVQEVAAGGAAAPDASGSTAPLLATTIESVK